MRVYLLGFMGCGKTTVGRLLAEDLTWPFMDLDMEIERAAGKPVREIFASEGEARFRALEQALLRRTLEPSRLVVATGGGTSTRVANLRLMQRHGVSVWLNPPFAAIVERIGSTGKPSRPLFRDEMQALALYRKRLGSYRQADLTLEVGPEETPEETAGRVRLLLRERCAT